MKRYIYIIIGIVVVAVIAILVILFIKNRSVSPTPTTTTTGTLPGVTSTTNPQGSTGQGNLPGTLTLSSSSSTEGESAAVTFGILSNVPVLDYFVDAQNNITAIQPDGTVIAIANGQPTTVNASTTSDIISASFSQDGEKILLNFGDPTNPQSSVFDFKTKSWTTLPSGMQSPKWSPSGGYQVSYLSSVGAGKFSLSMINVANLKSGVATLLTLNANDLLLQWPTKNQFILSDKPSSEVNGSVLSFNSQTGNIAPVVLEASGVESLWGTGTSTLGLVFSNGSTGQGPSLQLDTTSGSVLQQLSFLTLPSKCIFNTERSSTPVSAATSSNYLALYCGVPRSSDNLSNANLPDDYNMLALFTSDNIYKINITTGEIKNLWNDQAQNIDASDLKIFNGTLFFINRYDKKLYGLVLANI